MRIYVSYLLKSRDFPLSNTLLNFNISLSRCKHKDYTRKLKLNTLVCIYTPTFVTFIYNIIVYIRLWFSKRKDNFRGQIQSRLKMYLFVNFSEGDFCYLENALIWIYLKKKLQKFHINWHIDDMFKHFSLNILDTIAPTVQ